MIKDYFNRKYPADLTPLARFGRYAIVRGSFPRVGTEKIPCLYGVYITGSESLPVTDDGIILTSDEVKQLADLLQALISSGAIREVTPASEFEAAQAARKAAQEAARKTPRPLW